MAYIRSRLESIHDEGSLESVSSEHDIQSESNIDMKNETVKSKKSNSSAISIQVETRPSSCKTATPCRSPTKSAIPRLQTHNFHSKSFENSERPTSRDSSLKSKSFAENDSTGIVMDNVREENNKADTNAEENKESLKNLFLKKDASGVKTTPSSAQSTRTTIESKDNLLEIKFDSLDSSPEPTVALATPTNGKVTDKNSAKTNPKPSTDSLDKQNRNQPLKKAGTGLPLKIPEKSASKSSIDSSNSRVSVKPTQRQSLVHMTAQQNLEKQFRIKKQRLLKLKTELGEKQRPVWDLYQDLIGLKTKIQEQTGKSVELQELKFIDSKDMFPSSKTVKQITEPPVEVIEQLLNDFKTPLVEFCENVLKKRTETVEWLCKEPIGKNVIVSRQLEIHRKDNENMGKHFSNMLTELEKKSEAIVEEWKSLCGSVTVSDKNLIQSLKGNFDRQEVKMKSLTYELNTVNTQKQKMEKRCLESKKEIEDLKKQLELKNTALAEHEKKLVALNKDSKLFLIKQRAREVESRNKELEKELEEIKTKQLEDQQAGKRSRRSFSAEKFSNSRTTVKETEFLKLQQEKNSAELRIQTLEKDLEDLRQNFEEDNRRLESKCAQLERELTESEAEKDRNQKKYLAVRERLVKMEIKAQQMADAGKKKQLAGYSHPQGGTPTQVELDLWTELQATRVALKTAEEKLIKKQEEKARFMETIEKAVADKDTITNEGWTARLIQKDDEIEKLHRKVEKLSDTIIYSQDLTSRQEKKINELRKTLESLMENDGAARGDRDDTTMQGCKEKFENAIKRNAELEQKLIVKERALSKAESRLRDQENLLRVRDGVIGIMKSKKDVTVTEYDSLKEYVGDLMHQYNEINAKLNQKSEQMDQLHTSLECKTMQIERLEKTISSLELLCKEANIKNGELQDKIRCYQKTLQEANIGKQDTHITGYETNQSNLRLTNSEYSNSFVNPFSQDVSKINKKLESCSTSNEHFIDYEISSSQQEFIKCSKFLECSNHFVNFTEPFTNDTFTNIKDNHPINLVYLKQTNHEYFKTDSTCKGVTLFQALAENTKLVQSLTELQKNLSETLKMIKT